ncbi:hypothetical protein Zmor_028243 [Zophobas morio]|uniref:Uncharacterized protein n=1 Tax=Zophobas morio TaxID=2755281 RepID=A0AA38HQK1_9CUCU|nr:hypothetical protein Zmor_028243 [Zophobas morio]
MEDDEYDIRLNYSYTFAAYYAVSQKNYKKFCSIVDRDDFDINQIGEDGRTLLMDLATGPNSHKFGKKLLEDGADVHVKDKFGYSFLHLAARAKRVDNVKLGQLVIETGADVDCQDGAGVTPLYLACQEGNQKWIYMLLYYGANATLSTSAGVTPVCVLFEQSKQDDQNVLWDILYAHTFDSPLVSVSLSTLVAAMWRDSPLFLRLVKNALNVSCNEDDVDYFCKYLGDFKDKHVKLLLEKFDYVVENLLDMTDLFDVVLKQVTSTNKQEMFKILDTLLSSKNVSKLIHSTVSTSTVSRYLQEFASADLEDEIQKRIFVMLSYGLDVSVKDLDTVYRHYGFCDLFKTMLQMDLISVHEQDILSSVRLYYDLSLSIEDCCDDVLSVSDLLCYFNHPKLKEMCLSTSEDLELKRKVSEMCEVPFLVELSRNVARKYVISRYQIGTCKQFHAVLNGLPIDRVTKSIIALERKIY